MLVSSNRLRFFFSRIIVIYLTETRLCGTYRVALFTRHVYKQRCLQCCQRWFRNFRHLSFTRRNAMARTCTVTRKHHVRFKCDIAIIYKRRYVNGFVRSSVSATYHNIYNSKLRLKNTAFWDIFFSPATGATEIHPQNFKCHTIIMAFEKCSRQRYRNVYISILG